MVYLPDVTEVTNYAGEHVRLTFSDKAWILTIKEARDILAFLLAEEPALEGGYHPIGVRLKIYLANGQFIIKDNDGAYLLVNAWRSSVRKFIINLARALCQSCD